MPGFGANAIESPQRLMNILSLKKTGLGTPAISGSCAVFCSVTDNGVGNYTINFVSKPYAQIPEVLASSSTASRRVRLGTVTALAAQILVEDLAGVAAEGDFSFVAIGSLARDLIG